MPRSALSRLAPVPLPSLQGAGQAPDAVRRGRRYFGRGCGRGHGDRPSRRGRRHHFRSRIGGCRGQRRGVRRGRRRGNRGIIVRAGAVPEAGAPEAAERAGGRTTGAPCPGAHHRIAPGCHRGMSLGTAIATNAGVGKSSQVSHCVHPTAPVDRAAANARVCIATSPVSFP